MVTAAELGSAEFKKKYKIKYAYLAGSMYKAISSVDLVVTMANSNLLGFVGTGGLSLIDIEASIHKIRERLSCDKQFGFNLLHNINDIHSDDNIVNLYLKHNVTIVEAAAFMNVNKALVKYRLSGIKRNSNGDIEIVNNIIAKVAHLDVAKAFLSPAPKQIVDELFQAGEITREEASLAHLIPIANDICLEADSGGHTDRGNAIVMFPRFHLLRRDIEKQYKYQHNINLGLSGGIGTFESAAAAFMLGADFILTGSINQCTVESGMSDDAKDILQTLDFHDFTYAPAGDMFELGAKVQVVKKGIFFAAKANYLYEIYKQYSSLASLDSAILEKLEEKYFKKGISEVWNEVRQHYLKRPEALELAERNEKYKLALVFKSYFASATRYALQGSIENRLDYQIHSGPALGAFNQLLKNTRLENWRERHVDKIADVLMTGAANTISHFVERFENKNLQQAV